jgi:holo-[acyl-carrier protein] synthase
MVSDAYRLSIKNGIDMVRIDRINRAVKRLGQPFLERIWTDAERKSCHLEDDEQALMPSAAASLAVRFAAKEAVSKALGTGIGAYKIKWTDIAILRHTNENGPPELSLTGPALERYLDMGGISISISLTHEGNLATAQCVLLHRVIE